MKTPQKTTYYLIIETIGDVKKKNIPTKMAIRGLYSTQAKAIAELFLIAAKLKSDGTIFSNEDKTPISEIIHAQTINGESFILGYNLDTFQLIELQIKPIILDVQSLITT